MQQKTENSWLLAVDASTGTCSAALFRGQALCAERRLEERGQQAARLIPLIETLLTEADIAYADLGRIIVTTGPGGFTGLRIGLGTARAIGFAGGIPVFGISTLSCLAMGACASGMNGKVMALLNAGKQQVYAQIFMLNESIAPLSAPMILDAESIQTALAREACTAVGYASSHPLTPDAAQAGRTALFQPQLLTAPEPLYIRPPDAVPMAAKVN